MTAQVAELLEPLTELLPLASAMPDLVPLRRQRPELLSITETISEQLNERPCLASGLWLYVDDLDRSHSISQGLHTIEGALWHAVMHRREGDFGNSKYWLRQAGDVSIFEAVYGNPFDFVDRVQRDHRQNPAELVELQRQEWLALFEFCTANRAREGVE